MEQEFTPEQIEGMKAYIAEIEGGTKKETQEAPKPQPVRIKIGGTTFEGDSMDAVQAQIDAQMAQVARAQETARVAQAAKVEEPKEEPAGWDIDKDIFKAELEKRLGNDPREAFEYAVGAVLKKLKIEPERLTRLQHQQLMQEQAFAVAQFRQAHPEYMGNDQDRQVLEAIIQRGNFDTTRADQIEAAYLLARDKGLLTSIKKEEAAAEEVEGEEEIPAAKPKKKAPPKVGRGAAAPDASDELFDALDKLDRPGNAEQMRAALLKLYGN